MKESHGLKMLFRKGRKYQPRLQACSPESGLISVGRLHLVRTTHYVCFDPQILFLPFFPEIADEINDSYEAYRNAGYEKPEHDRYLMLARRGVVGACSEQEGHQIEWDQIFLHQIRKC